MTRKELPFRTTGETLPLGEGTCTDVFGFTPEKGKEYLYKELRPKARVLKQYRGETLEETAALMRKAYGVLKRHCGDDIVPTHYLIAKNKEGDPCIMLVQERVRGERVYELQRRLRSEKKALPREVQRQIDDIYSRAEEAGKDPELIALVEKGKIYIPAWGLFGEVRWGKNLIVDKHGRVRVVDW